MTSSRSFASADLLAGLAVAGLLLPEAVAYAGIANLPPQAGVIGLAVGLLCYGALGTSRFALVTATSSSAAVLAAAIPTLQPRDATHALVLAAALVLLSGVFFIAAGLFRIGHVANFIAKPVLRGFVFGLSVVISLKQFAVMVSLPLHHSSVAPMVYELVSRWRDWNIAGLEVGLAAFVLLLLMARFNKFPGTLIVMIAGIVATSLLQLTARGVAVVGPLQLSLASVSFPQLEQNEWLRLGELAIALTLVLFAESYTSIRTCALRHGDRVSVDRDLVAIGVANVIAGICRGTPVGAGFTATLANEAAGARSRASGLIAAAAIIVAVAAFLPQIAAIPEPVLAAIVVYAVRHSLGLQALRPYFTWKRDRIVAGVAIAAVMIFGILNGLLIAVATSLIMMLRALAEPQLSELGRYANGHDFVKLKSAPAVQRVAGVLILRPEAPLFFANAEPMFAAALAQLATTANIHTVVLSLEESPDLDGTSIEALREFDSRVRQHGQRLLLARLKERTQDALRHAQLTDLLPARSDVYSVDDVVSAATKWSQRD